MFDLSRVRVFKNFDKNSKNWHRWLWEAFVFFYLLLKKSVTTLCFKLSIRSRSNNLSMFSTRNWISFSCILKMERSCSVSNASTTSLVEGRVGSLFSSSSWSSSLSSFSLSITSAKTSSLSEKEDNYTIQISKRFSWKVWLNSIIIQLMRFLEILLQTFEWIVIIVRCCLLLWLTYVRFLETAMVSFDTVFHDDTKCFIGWRILILRSGLLLSYGFWGFALHPGPLVEEQTLYLETGKSGWCSWGS